ncbi:MAG: UDP-N-acetylmuramate--L-alanine ligase [Planctomycetes bacterium]|nr:UDP-N-acetylmuramate--L-alanine ligase [Planctomycetota bacterium]
MDGQPVNVLADEHKVPTAHLVGVCGAGMKALAELLDGLGWRLSGSDLQASGPSITALGQHGFRFFQGHTAENLPADADCLVYSPAIRPGNAERMEAARRAIPEWSYSQMIGQLMGTRTGIGVSGTHGKSTTTAMVGWILSVAGFDPAVLVGAELCDGGHSGRAGQSGLLVVESCEFNHSFLDFQPTHAAILNVEPDHFDCYADLPSLVRAFREFARRLPARGVLLVNRDCAAAMDSVRDVSARIVTFGNHAESDWQAHELTDGPDGIRFAIRRREEPWGAVTLRLHGRHNVQNALAAAAMCAELEVRPDDICAGLSSFGGVRRRFEVVGEWQKVTLIDDYAHHPTAIRATLETARQVYGDRRIWCVFQPHQVSRTVALMDDFASSFASADEVLIAPAFAARERVQDEPAQVSRELARRIAGQGVSSRFTESLDQILTTVDDATRPGDVLIAMGAGDIDRIHHELTRRIR